MGRAVIQALAELDCRDVLPAIRVPTLIIHRSGDGFLATFTGPSRAIDCATAIRDELRQIGIDIRAGLHTGECELVPGDIGGLAVHIAARVVALAGTGEVLVSNTVKDLVV